MKTVLITLVAAGLFLLPEARGASSAANWNFERDWRPRRVFLYSESTFLSVQENVVMDTQLHFTLASPLHGSELYAGLAMAQDLRSTPEAIYNDNHVSPLVGANLRLGSAPLSLFAEYRRAHRVIGRSPTLPAIEGEFRGGAFGYRWWDLVESESTRPFSENYGEAVYTSRVPRNLFMNAWSKLGLRRPLGRGWDADAFMELQLGREGWGTDTASREQAGAGARLAARFGGLGGELETQLLFRAQKNLVPALEERPWNWTSQLVLTGEL